MATQRLRACASRRDCLRHVRSADLGTQHLRRVGSNLANDFFLEVTSRPWPDGTSDEPARVMAKGKVPVEVVIARCASTIKPVTVQGQFNSGSFDSLPTTATLDPKLLTPPL